MRTAVKLAMDSVQSGTSDWSGNEPVFHIRHRTVDFNEVRRYFQRKDILNPIEWFSSLPSDSFEMSDYVSIVPRSNPAEVGLNEALLSPCSSSNAPAAGAASLENISFVTQQPLPSPENSPILRAPSPPSQLALNERLIWYAGAYCMYFFQFASATRFMEPAVHMHTIHGRLGARMQDGLFHASQMKLDLARESFEKAHDMIPPLFQEESHFAFAQVFTVLCELTAASRYPSTAQSAPGLDPFLAGIIQLLLQDLLDWAHRTLDPSHPLIEFLGSLQKVEDILNSLVVSMHKMLDCFFQQPTSWHGLYLLERYCDCLYYAGIAGER